MTGSREWSASVDAARAPVLIFLAKTGFTLAHFGTAARAILPVAGLVGDGTAGGGESDLLRLVQGLKAAHAKLLRTAKKNAPTWEQFYQAVMAPVLARRSLPDPFSWKRVGRDQWRVVEAYDSEQELSALFQATNAQTETLWTLRPSHPLLNVPLLNAMPGTTKIQRLGTIEQRPGTTQYLVKIEARASMRVKTDEVKSVLSVPDLKHTLHTLVHPHAPPIPTCHMRKITTRDPITKVPYRAPLYQDIAEMLIHL